MNSKFTGSPLRHVLIIAIAASSNWHWTAFPENWCILDPEVTVHMQCTSRLICNSPEVIAYDSKDRRVLRFYHVSEDALPFLVKMNTDSHWIKPSVGVTLSIFTVSLLMVWMWFSKASENHSSIEHVIKRVGGPRQSLDQALCGCHVVDIHCVFVGGLDVI